MRGGSKMTIGSHEVFGLEDWDQAWTGIGCFNFTYEFVLDL